MVSFFMQEEAEVRHWGWQMSQKRGSRCLTVCVLCTYFVQKTTPFTYFTTIMSSASTGPTRRRRRGKIGKHICVDVSVWVHHTGMKQHYDWSTITLTVTVVGMVYDKETRMCIRSRRYTSSCWRKQVWGIGGPLRDLGYGNRTLPRCFVDSQSTGRDCGTLQLRVRYDPIQRDCASPTTCCSLPSNVWSNTTLWSGSYPTLVFTSSSGANHLRGERISRGGGRQVVRKRRMPCLSSTNQVRPSPPPGPSTPHPTL